MRTPLCWDDSIGHERRSERIVMKKKRIIIFTWCHLGHANYGQVLQSYALSKACEHLGFDVEVLRYRKPYEKERIDLIPDEEKEYDEYEKELFLSSFKDASVILYDIFEEFVKQNIKRTKHCHNQQQVIEACKKADIIVVGSDQLWNPALFDEIYTPDYFDDNKRIITYATSGISCDKGIYKRIIEKIAYRTRDFEAVSVREKIGQEILAKYSHKKIDVVVDPTLLLSRKDWDNIASKRLIKEEYILCFCYSGFQPHKHLIKELRKNYTEIDKICLVSVDGAFDNPNLLDGMFIYSYAGIEDFLSLIKYASIVCTDSFHGFVFSLIYQKQVYLLSLSYTAEDFISSERIKCLSTILGVGSRWLRNKKDLRMIKPMDYDMINKKMKKGIQDSKDYLIDALRYTD